MDDDAARTVQKILFSDGWSRLPVHSAIVLLTIVAGESPITRDGLHRSLLDGRNAEHGLNDAAWDEPHVYTDQELADLDEHFEGTPFETPQDEIRTAVEANADEQARRQADVADMQRYCQALGVGELHTLADLLDFFVAAGVILEQPSGDLTLNPHAPLPAEVLPLDEREVAVQDEMRWARLHAGIANDLIGLFRPNDGVRVLTLQASLADYANQLGKDDESVRAAIEQLLDEGDFTADATVSAVPASHVFLLTVDWAQFAKKRIAIRRSE